MFVSGTAAQISAQKAVLDALPPALVTELSAATEKYETVRLEDEELAAHLGRATETTDHGASAIAMAKLLARVAPALPK